MIRRIRILALAMLAAAPLTATAQSATRAPSGCTYETCALRVEQRFWTPSRLVRGRDGVEVGKLGGFGGGVDSLLAGPDTAAMYARRYVKAARTSNALALLGTAAVVAMFIHMDDGHDPDGTDIALGVTGVAFGIAAIPIRLHATQSLSRSVWFYNAQFAR